MNKRKIVKWTLLSSLTIGVAFYALHLWQSADSGSGVAETTPPGSIVVGDSLKKTVGVIPVDLTRGGTKRITWHLESGTCVDIYDHDMVFLTEDCSGEFHDLRGKSPTYFASSRSNEVTISYNIW